jgi:hypothetical protein
MKTRSEVGKKNIKEMKDKKATGDGDVSGKVLKLLREDGLKIMTPLFNNMYETGKWPQDVIAVTVIALKKKPYNPPYRTCSKDSSEDTYNMVWKGIEDVVGEDHYGFRSGKGTGDAVNKTRTNFGNR